MDLKLNVLHVAVALGAAGCLRAIMHETHGRLVRPGRLFTAPVLALLTALVLLLLIPVDMRQHRLWALTLATGFVAGALRGFTMRLQVDHEFDLLRLPSAPDGVGSSVILAMLAAISVVLAMTMPADAPLELMVEMLAAAGVALCAGFLGGRAVLIYLRHLRAPHLQLLRL